MPTQISTSLDPQLVSNGYLAETIYVPATECYYARGHDGELYKRDPYRHDGMWQSWEPDVITLALKGQTSEIHVVAKLLAIPA